MKLLSALFSGILFGTGIALSGMINPAKVLNFFDIAGTWDPSLIFVMGGGLATALVGYRIVFGARPRPVFEPAYILPTARDIDARLVGGSALFGVGWGISGFCPGGAIPAIGLGYSQTALFIAAMVGGIVFARMLNASILRPSSA